MKESVITVSVRFMSEVRGFSTVYYITSYSLVVTKYCLTTYELSVPTLMIAKKSVRTKGCYNGAIMRTSLSTTEFSNTSRTRLFRVRRDIYPSFNTYPSVKATGAVRVLNRVLGLIVPKASAVPTSSGTELHTTEATKGCVMRLTESKGAPGSLVAGSILRGTVVFSVTITKSAGTMLRVLTCTCRLNVGLALTSFRGCTGRVCYVGTIVPDKPCAIMSFRCTNNMGRIVGRLTNGVRASTPAVCKSAA